MKAIVWCTPRRTSHIVISVVLKNKKNKQTKKRKNNNRQIKAAPIFAFCLYESDCLVYAETSEAHHIRSSSVNSAFYPRRARHIIIAVCVCAAGLTLPEFFATTATRVTLQPFSQSCAVQQKQYWEEIISFRVRRTGNKKQSKLMMTRSNQSFQTSAKNGAATLRTQKCQFTSRFISYDKEVWLNLNLLKKVWITRKSNDFFHEPRPTSVKKFHQNRLWIFKISLM